MLAGCSGPQPQPSRSPEEIRAQIVRSMPTNVPDRAGWASDIQAAFAALRIEASTQNLCAAMAIAEQESSFHVETAVPGMGKSALAEIDRRAAEHHIPQFLVHAALLIKSPNGKRYAERLAAAHSEEDLSNTYEDFIGSVPLGKRLFAGDNPIHTVGPMQVSVAFAEQYAKSHSYPYPLMGSIRHELNTRRGGVYFGIAHLLGYSASYPLLLYRFADYNAGFYASRNAAFQQAVSIASGIPLAFDGDVVSYGRGLTGTTEAAVRSLSGNIALSDAQIHRTLEQGEGADFEDSALYARVFALAEQRAHKPLPRAILPRIELESPKITHNLTTAWFAKHVDEKYRRCMARAVVR